MTDLVNKVREEAKFLGTLLQGLGFYVRCTRNIEDSLDRAMDTEYRTVDCYYIMLDNMTVGNCCIYHKINNAVLFTSTVNARHIPKKMINPLILLGYEDDGDDWLEYEIEIT